MINITEEYRKAMALLDTLSIPQDRDGKRLTLAERINALNARNAKMLIEKLELHLDTDVVVDEHVEKFDTQPAVEKKDEPPETGDIEFACEMLKEGRHVRRTSVPSVTYWLKPGDHVICSLDIDNPWLFTSEECEAEDWAVVGSNYPTTKLPGPRNARSLPDPFLEALTLKGVTIDWDAYTRTFDGRLVNCTKHGERPPYPINENDIICAECALEALRTKEARNEGSSIPPNGKVFFNEEHTGSTLVIEPLPPVRTDLFAEGGPERTETKECKHVYEIGNDKCLLCGLANESR